MPKTAASASSARGKWTPELARGALVDVVQRLRDAAVIGAGDAVVLLAYSEGQEPRPVVVVHADGTLTDFDVAISGADMVHATATS